jgi:HEAT repeat protein
MAKGPPSPQGVYLSMRAAVALHRAGSPDGVGLIVDAARRAPGHTATPYVYALLECGPEGVAALRKLTAYEDPTIRAAAVDAIGSAARKDPGVVADLTGLLKDRDPSIRLRALTALGAAGPNAKSAAPAIAGLLKDPSPQTRLEAAVALAHIGTTDGRVEALALLRSALTGRVPGTVQTRTIEAVGRLGADAADAVPDLRRFLTGPDDALKMVAAEALGRIGKPAAAAAPRLTELLRDSQPAVKTHAAVALWRITGEAEPVVPTLTAAVNHPGLRRTAVQHRPVYYSSPVGSYWGPPSAQFTPPYAQPEMATPPALLAVRTLGEIGPPARPAADALRQLEKDTDLELREAAAAALKRIDTE